MYLIQAGNYIGREKPKALKAHSHLMEPVTDAHFNWRSLLGAAFGLETREPWVELLRVSTHVLRFCGSRSGRLLEELPHPVSGFSRTEWAILSLIDQGFKSPAGILRHSPSLKRRSSYGDSSFYHALDTLGAGGAPLIAGFNGLTSSPSMPEEERMRILQPNCHARISVSRSWPGKRTPCSIDMWTAISEGITCKRGRRGAGILRPGSSGRRMRNEMTAALRTLTVPVDLVAPHISSTSRNPFASVAPRLLPER